MNGQWLLFLCSWYEYRFSSGFGLRVWPVSPQAWSWSASMRSTAPRYTSVTRPATTAASRPRRGSSRRRPPASWRRRWRRSWTGPLSKPSRYENNAVAVYPKPQVRGCHSFGTVDFDFFFLAQDSIRLGMIISGSSRVRLESRCGKWWQKSTAKCVQNLVLLKVNLTGCINVNVQRQI